MPDIFLVEFEHIPSLVSASNVEVAKETSESKSRDGASERREH